MSKFIFEVYELHSQQYEVEADTFKEAVEKYQQGDSIPNEDSFQYIEIPDEYGANADELPAELYDVLDDAGLVSKSDIVMGVRSITKDDEELV